MEEQKIISVIVPIYKVEEFLKRCIESLLIQTFTNYELILVDDGSPDNCPQICDKYAEYNNKIRVIHKENGGLSDARNAGLDIAKGEFVAFVDSDDVVDSHYLEYLYRAVIENDCDIAVCGYEVFEEFVPAKEVSYSSGNTYSGIDMLWRIYSKNHTEYVESTVSWNKLYRKRLFDKIRFPKGKIHEDEATTYKIYCNARKVCVIPCTLYYYYQNQTGIMKRKFNTSRLDYLEALYERYFFFSEKGFQNLAAYTAKLLYIFTVDYAALEENQVEDYSKFRKRLIDLYRCYRTILLKQDFTAKDKVRILLSYINFDFLTKHF